MSKTAGSRVTLKRIAHEAGCSVTAVSTVLNHSKGTVSISDGLRERIEGVARDLGYRPNYHAQALRRGRSGVVGMVVGRRDAGAADYSGFWGALAEGVDQGLRRADEDLLIVTDRGTQNELDRGIQLLGERRIDALIVPAPFYPDRMQDLAAVEGPIVLAVIEHPTLTPDGVSAHPGVSMDEGPGVREALQHLRDLGHRSLLWIGYREHGRDYGNGRAQAIRTCASEMALTLSELQLTEEAVGFPQPNAESIGRCRAWLAEHLPVGAELPTALMVFSESVGLAAMSVLAQRGLRIPEDVSLIGFDDFYAELAIPPMSVVSLNMHGVGRRSVDLALRMADDRDAMQQLAGHVERVPMYLVTRQSTAAPPQPARKAEG